MQTPSRLEADTTFAQLLQDLPPQLKELARENNAFTRSRKIKDPEELLRMVLLYCGLDKTLRETAAVWTLLWEQITDEAVSQRLNGCRNWLKAMLRKMLQPGEITEGAEGLRWVVVDGSSIQTPGAKGTSYRLHLCMDLQKLEMSQIKVTDKREGEGLHHYEFKEGEVVIADRGYAKAREMIKVKKSGAELVIRICAQNLPLYERSGLRIELCKRLRKEGSQSGTIAVKVVSVKDEGEIEGYLHWYRLDKQAVEKVNRRRRRIENKRGRKAKSETIFFDGYLLVFTTIDPAILSAETISQLYRARWQIEMMIKRLKSLLRLDQLRAHQNSPLAEVWLIGKMLYALLIERKAKTKLVDEWSDLSSERKITPWRIWQIIKDELTATITGIRYWREEGWKECLGVVTERPRKRRLQTMPDEAARLQNIRPLPFVKFAAG